MLVIFPCFPPLGWCVESGLAAGLLKATSLWLLVRVEWDCLNGGANAPGLICAELALVADCWRKGSCSSMQLQSIHIYIIPVL